MKITKHKFRPKWPNEICIEHGNKSGQFTITLKQVGEIEIEFDWDHGYGGRGTGRMYIPVEVLKNLIDELDKL